MFYRILLLLLFSYETFTLDKDRDKCIRCICYAVSACTSLINCAEKSVDYNYWLESGDSTKTSHSDCIQDEICILNTIEQYTKKLTEFTNDINCDQKVNCQDYLAVHKYGKLAKRSGNQFTRAESRRFDLCTGGNLTETGWNPQICFIPK